MWLEPALPVVAAVLAAGIAWHRETRRLDRRALHEPWDGNMTGEDFRRAVIDRRKRRRWSVTLLSACAGSAAATMLLQLANMSGVIRFG